MQLAENQSTESWQISEDVSVLTDIFLPEKHVAVWQRDSQAIVNDYFAAVFDELGQGLRQVYSVDSLKQALLDKFPAGEGRLEAIEDICLLSDMVACLFDCEDIGLRLAPMSQAMCPRFHVDHIPARLVCTYLGDGTQWLPTEWIVHAKLGKGANGLSDDKSGLYSDPEAIQQLKAFDVGILKGSAWEDDVAKAAVHRSCPVEPGQKRILLTLDPM